MVLKNVQGCTSGCGLAGIDVADDDDVDVSLFLTVRMTVSIYVREDSTEIVTAKA